MNYFLDYGNVVKEILSENSIDFTNEILDNIVDESDKIGKEQEKKEYRNFLSAHGSGQLLQEISDKTTIMDTKLLSDTGRKATLAIIFSSDICYPVGPVSSNLLHTRHYQQFMGENISEFDPYHPTTIIRFRLEGLDSHFNHLLDNLEYVHKFLGVPVYARPLQRLIYNKDIPMNPLTLSSLNPIKKEVDKQGVPDKKVLILDLRDFDTNKGRGKDEK